MDPIKSIGKLLTGGEQRDCIHVAILPCMIYRENGKENTRDWYSAGDPVKPMLGDDGQPLRKGDYYLVTKAHGQEYGDPGIGIIDPYLPRGPERKNDAFWVWLYPGSVVGMRHYYTHPALDNPPAPSTNESERWLKKFAEKWNFDYEEMIEQAQFPDGFVVARGIDLHSRSELEEGDEGLFWEHLGKLTGKHYDEGHRDKFSWSCSC